MSPVSRDVLGYLLQFGDDGTGRDGFIAIAKVASAG
jgi:hypothetical protein